MIKNSIIIPAFNEYENILDLIKDIEIEFKQEISNNEIEVIIINDGSTDMTRENLHEKMKTKKINIKIVHLIKNQGKSFALEVSFNYVAGENIIIIDADQQYQIKDVRKLLSIMQKNNFDLVNGKRENRKDDDLTKFTSKIYNFFIRKILNVKCSDFFSGLKVFKSKIIKKIDFRDLCRFIILLAHTQGFKIFEEPINHKKRIHGRSRYNFLSRFKLSINDLITIFFLKFINKYRVYLLNIYLRFCLVLYFLYSIYLLLFTIDFGFKEFLNNKIFIFLIISNAIAIMLDSIISLHENRHKLSFSERLKNIDVIQNNKNE
tara:strand:- start:523 stop:1479 length:957 start_codon:yes stop_codon:yes gene_type:complete